MDIIKNWIDNCIVGEKYLQVTYLIGEFKTQYRKNSYN